MADRTIGQAFQQLRAGRVYHIEHSRLIVTIVNKLAYNLDGAPF